MPDHAVGPTSSLPQGELGDDALWEMNPGFVDFTKKVEKNGEDDASLK